MKKLLTLLVGMTLLASCGAPTPNTPRPRPTPQISELPKVYKKVVYKYDDLSSSSGYSYNLLHDRFDKVSKTSKVWVLVFDDETTKRVSVQEFVRTNVGDSILTY